MVFQLTKRTDTALQVLGSVLVLVAWELTAGPLNLVHDTVLPAPSEIYSEFVRVPAIILDNFLITLTESVIGFVGALVVGIGFGILITLNSRVREAALPYIVGGNSVPRVTLAPIIIFYVGGFQAKYLLAAWLAVFPLLLNTIEGLSDIDENHENLLETFETTKWQEYRYVRIPAALPFIFDGIKLSITLAVIGAVLGEFLTVSRGLGGLALYALRDYQIALAFAVLGLMGVVSVFAFLGVYVLQDRVVHWQKTELFVK